MEQKDVFFNKIFITAMCLMLAVLLAAMLMTGVDRTAPGAPVDSSDDGELPAAPDTQSAYISASTSATAVFSSQLDAEYALLVDLGSGHDVAARGADSRIYPASMTKVMTLLVAAEMVEDVNAYVNVSAAVLAEAYLAGASCAGFSAGERVTVLDLMYGAALPSGADATGTLAIYVGGSESGFVKLMNQRAAELGLTSTHFVNSSGLHDPDHYTTPREMAAIMACAMDNALCRTLLSARSYTTSSTAEHPEGLTLYSTAFSRMSTDIFGSASLVAAKTGFTDEARFCLVSYAETASGGRYILVTASGSDRYAPVYDCKYAYGTFAY